MNKRLRYSLAVCILCVVAILGCQLNIIKNTSASISTHGTIANNYQLQRLYNQILPVKHKPSYEVFSTGFTGYQSIAKEGKLQNRKYLTLIDFSLPSTTKRLWVIDLESMKVIYHSLVAHGKNTGNNYAVNFSNTPDSNMSSLGFFITGKTYNGKHGFSLRLEGIEKEINDNAKERAIVIHGADYASQEFIVAYGRLGRSFGCPALPISEYKPIINTIKDKSCLFIYFPDESYFIKSKYAALIQ